MVPKVNSMLEELGLGYRPHMHTMEITARFEEVRALLQSKAELVKAIEKAEADLKSASDRKIQVQEELVSGQLSKSLKRAASSGASTPRPIKRSKNS